MVTVHLTLAGLRRRLDPSPASDTSALDVDRLGAKTEPVEAESQNGIGQGLVQLPAGGPIVEPQPEPLPLPTPASGREAPAAPPASPAMRT